MQSAAMAAPKACLIVEDSAFDRKRILRIARRTGLHLTWTEADCLIGARTHLARQTFDLVILDYLLADGTGLELATEISAGAFGSPARTILLTGYGSELLSLQARVAGCAGYLAKRQLDPAYLRNSMLRALGLDEAGQTTTAFDRPPPADPARLKAALERGTTTMAALRDATDAAALSTARERLVEVVIALNDVWTLLNPERPS